MAEDDDRRVVMVPLTVAGGMTATPEGVAELERRRAQVERASRPPPTRDFGTLVKKAKEAAARVAAEPTEKEKRLAALPKRGPKPALAHPSQRAAYGRDGETDEDVVLKG